MLGINIIPTIFLSIFALIGLLVIIWFWALISCINSDLTAEEKLLWAILIIFFNLLGAFAYLIVVRIMGKKLIEKTQLKGKRLVRPKKGKVFAGVCAGIANYFGIDPTIIRLLWALLTIFGGIFLGIIAYIIAAIIIPEEK